MENIFVDADVLIGLNDNFDPLHEKAIQLSKVLYKKSVSLVTGTNILIEVVTLLSQRLGHKKAVEFLAELRSGNTKVIHPSQETVFEAEEIFKRQTSKNVSYSDCVSFAIMRDQKIRVAFSFDRDFKKNGFTLLEEYLRKN